MMLVSFNGIFLADVKLLDSRIIQNIMIFRTLILNPILIIIVFVLRFINPLMFVNFSVSLMG